MKVFCSHIPFNAENKAEAPGMHPFLINLQLNSNKASLIFNNYLTAGGCRHKSTLCTKYTLVATFIIANTCRFNYMVG